MPIPVKDSPSRSISVPGEDQFRLLVKSVKDYAIFMLDPGGHVVSWNEGAQRIKGYSQEEILGRHFSVFYPAAAVASGWPEHELRCATADGRFEDEGWRIRKDGSRFWANVVITAVRDGDGVLRGFAKVTRDLTERRFAEETLRQSEERYRSLVDAVKDYAIFMLDPLGNVITWNAGAERLKGYTAAEIYGRHFSIFYPQPLVDSGWPDYELEVARKEGRFVDEGWRIRKDGSRFWALVVITALFDAQGRLQGFSKVTRDMTDRKLLEERQRQLNEELTLRVEELGKVNAALAEKSRQNEAFVYSVSHDVRGPLANVQGFSEEIQASCHELAALLDRSETPQPLREAAGRILDLDMAESIRFIQSGVTHLSHIVDGLLRLSRVGRVVYAVEEVDVDAAVRRVLDALGATIERQGASVEIGKLPPAYADPAAIEQIFSNLIGNALQYRDPARPLRIEIGGAAGGPRNSYYVKDNGLGIPDDARDNLFTGFRRFHPESAPGEGIGLAMVQRIVDRHHGTICVRSQHGEGSTFILELPNRPEGAGE